MELALKLDDLGEEQRQIAETIGMDAYLSLTKVFGGTTIYVAKANEILRRNERDRRIREEFNGYNYAQLALKYGLTEVWIRNIVSEKAEAIRKKPVDGQMNISDFFRD